MKVVWAILPNPKLPCWHFQCVTNILKHLLCNAYCANVKLTQRYQYFFRVQYCEYVLTYRVEYVYNYYLDIKFRYDMTANGKPCSWIFCSEKAGSCVAKSQPTVGFYFFQYVTNDVTNVLKHNLRNAYFATGILGSYKIHPQILLICLEGPIIWICIVTLLLLAIWIVSKVKRTVCILLGNITNSWRFINFRKWIPICPQFWRTLRPQLNKLD